MIESIDEFFEKVEKNLTFKETLDFEEQFKFNFFKMGGEFRLYADTLYKSLTSNIAFVYQTEVPLVFKSALKWCEYYEKLIPEKSNIKIKWRIPKKEELLNLIYDSVMRDFYGVPVDSNKYYNKIDYWNNSLFWTDNIFLNKKNNNVVNCCRVECGVSSNGFYDRKFSVAIKDELENENRNVHTILVGEVIENV